mmetsp:Transcript_748/g.2691  ORF Transcript_748/g.2691 Transcript_748/m.2691 type:complete len:649 (-) Transcript_748:48-1994(-)
MAGSRHRLAANGLLVAVGVVASGAGAAAASTCDEAGGCCSLNTNTVTLFGSWDVLVLALVMGIFMILVGLSMLGWLLYTFKSLTSPEEARKRTNSARVDSLQVEEAALQDADAAEADYFGLERGAKQRGRFAILPVFYIYTFIAAVWFIAQGVLLLMPASSATGLVSRLLFSLHATLDWAIVVLSFFKPLKRNAWIATAVFCLLNTGLLSGLVVVDWAMQDCSGDSCAVFMPYKQSTFVFFYSVVVFCILLALSFIEKATYKPRKTVQLWLGFLAAMHLLAALGTAIWYFGDSGVGFCLVDVAMVLTVFLYLPVLYFTGLQESKAQLSTGPTKANLSTPANGGYGSVLTSSDRSTIEIEDDEVSNQQLIEGLLKEYPTITWIDISKIQKGPRLGLGASAEVRQGNWGGTPVAIKKLFNDGKQGLPEFFREVKVMSKLSHPNVILFMGIFVDECNRYIITELMSRGSVYDIIHNPSSNDKLDGEKIRQILLHTARGMSYLHSFEPPILHRDLKSHNLLVDKDWNVKVADFGLSRAQIQATMTATGTPQWSAPEVIRHERYSTKADVYSFGVIIYELLSGTIPYRDIGPMTALHNVAYQGLRPNFSDDSDPAYVELAKECWADDPEQRPPFAALVEVLVQMDAPVTTTTT